MFAKRDSPTLSIYIPNAKAEQQPLGRLRQLSKERDRSINYLIVEAILQYLDREERQEERNHRALEGSSDED
jgi:predicted transcriptional regulator